MRGFTYGGDGTAKRRSLAFALIFFASFLHQGKKEEYMHRKLFANEKSPTSECVANEYLWVLPYRAV